MLDRAVPSNSPASIQLRHRSATLFGPFAGHSVRVRWHPIADFLLFAEKGRANPSIRQKV
jgi:hypothetical protein